MSDPVLDLARLYAKNPIEILKAESPMAELQSLSESLLQAEAKLAEAEEFALIVQAESAALDHPVLMSINDRASRLLAKIRGTDDQQP